MKRSELHVGDELYWAKPYEWTHDRMGEKVTVLHVEPYGRAEYGRREIRKEYDGKGNGVHVQVHNPSFGSREDVVRLGDLRGPWEVVKNNVEARQKEARRREDEEWARRNDMAATRNEMTRRAKGAGYAFTVNYGRDSDDLVATTVETLGAMLDRIEALTLKVDALQDQITDLLDQAGS